MTLKPGDIVELADGTVIGPIKQSPFAGWLRKDGYFWTDQGKGHYGFTHKDCKTPWFDVVAVVTVTRKDGEG